MDMVPLPLADDHNDPAAPPAPPARQAIAAMPGDAPPAAAEVERLERLADAEEAAGRPDRALAALRQALALLRPPLGTATLAARTPGPSTRPAAPDATTSAEALLQLGSALDARAAPDYCVVRIDLDHFGRTCERYTAEVVERALGEVAGLLRSGSRQADTVLRAAPGQLVLVLDRCTAAQGTAHSERLRRAIATHDWPRLAPGLWVTASFGVAPACTGQRFAEVLAAADARVHSAQRAGRNRVVA